MRRRSAPAEQPRGRLFRRLDDAAAWINPFLMTIAIVLAIVDMACGVALVVARLPITHIGAPPPAQDLPPGTVSTAVQ